MDAIEAMARAHFEAFAAARGVSIDGWWGLQSPEMRDASIGYMHAALIALRDCPEISPEWFWRHNIYPHNLIGDDFRAIINAILEKQP